MKTHTIHGSYVAKLFREAVRQNKEPHIRIVFEEAGITLDGYLTKTGSEDGA